MLYVKITLRNSENLYLGCCYFISLLFLVGMHKKQTKKPRAKPAVTNKW